MVNNLVKHILPARSYYLDDLVGVLSLWLVQRRGSIWNLLASVEDLSWVGCRYRLRVPPFLVQRQGCNECTNYVLTSSIIPAFLHACWREVCVASQRRIRISVTLAYYMISSLSELTLLWFTSRSGSISVDSLPARVGIYGVEIICQLAKEVVSVTIKKIKRGGEVKCMTLCVVGKVVRRLLSYIKKS